jgi:endonuclease YncB( thermonuclease family)
MVEEGFAVAFGAYQSEEAAARSARRGIWASEFERPQEWRRRNMPGSL